MSLIVAVARCSLVVLLSCRIGLDEEDVDSAIVEECVCDIVYRRRGVVGLYAPRQLHIHRTMHLVSGEASLARSLALVR
jgi:hypothetical protein